jgi:hypothetical protein
VSEVSGCTACSVKLDSIVAYNSTHVVEEIAALKKALQIQHYDDLIFLFICSNFKILSKRLIEHISQY